MTGDVVIQAEGLGKKYVINHEAERERYTALRDVMARNVKNLFRKRSTKFGAGTEEFWALKDINFEIKRGEVIGIIGRNGAGKSTLLKVLSRITEPSEGRVQIRGRVASLLEVGTGFHPELTGRENIYLNGAILGMSRAEIRGKFDEIVAFADVERFLDTPVKRYSSGMYVRLAFAVAAHMEPEILIVDEVLAVGDSEFQRKCLGRMKEVSAGGRTVLFVSHNLDVISRICGRAVLLANGTIEAMGESPAIISRYHTGKRQNVLHKCSTTIGEVNLDIILTLPADDHPNASKMFSLTLGADQTISISEFALLFYTINGQRVGIVDFRTCLNGGVIQQNHRNQFTVTIDNFDLVEGEYDLKLWVNSVSGSANIDLGHAELTNSDTSSYLTQYAAQWNGMTKFKGNVSRLQLCQR